MVNEKVRINNTNIYGEAEIVESSIGLETFIDKYTRVEHSNLAEHVRLERNNQIVLALEQQFLEELLLVTGQ